MRSSIQSDWYYQIHEFVRYRQVDSCKGRPQLRGERGIARRRNAATKSKAFNSALASTLSKYGYPQGNANPADIDKPMVVVILLLLLTFGTMTFAPMSAMLVELFPSRIRFTAMSFPYHMGVAIFGGFLPAAAFAIVAATGRIYSGLWYPVAVAAFSFVVVLLFAKEKSGSDIYQEG